MLWFEYDGSHNEGVTDQDTEMAFIRENMPPATSCRYDTDFTVIVWDTKVVIIEIYVFADGRPTVWYFTVKEVIVDAWPPNILTVGENTAVAARWIRKRVKRFERKEESSRLVNDFILCLEEMLGSEKSSPTWECALSDAGDRLTDLCALVGVPAEEVIGSDIYPPRPSNSK